MPLPLNLLNQRVTIKRRQSTGTDSLGNPIYGEPTLGGGWSTVYNNLAVALAFSSKPTQFASEGERITPVGTMYFNPGTNLKPEDRVLTADGIEYNIISVNQGFLIGTVISHWECTLQLP